MAGFIAAPPEVEPARVRLDGQSPIELSGDGLTLVPGTGVIGRTDTAARRISLDAITADPVQSFHLFRPGAVAGGVLLGKWSNTNRSRATYVQALQANLATAPTGGDATNHYRLRATDGAGRDVVLPLSTAGVAHYSLDQGSGVAIARPLLPGGAGTTTHAATLPFIPSQPLVVTGAYLPKLGLIRNSDGVILSGTVRASLLDANFQTLAEAYTDVATAANYAALGEAGWAFPLSVSLTAGLRYHLAFDHWDWYPGSVGNQEIRLYFPSQSGVDPAAQPVALDSAARRGIDSSANADIPAQFGGITWQHAAPGSVLPPGVPAFTSTPQLVPCSLLGSPSGAVKLTGSLTFHLDAIGAAVAGAAGADLNVHALLVP